MNMSLARFGARLLSCVRLALMTSLALLPSLLPAKVAYQQATFGKFDILSSVSPKITREVVAELMEVRRQVQELVGDLPLPNPRIQVVIFDSAREFRESVPADAGGVKNDYEAMGLFTADDFGITFSLIRGETFIPAKEIGLTGYARYLLSNAVPNAPLWVAVGLPEVLSTVTCRGDVVRLGDKARNHAENVKSSTIIPLRDLIDDRVMRRHVDTFKHDTVLYHQAWALWQHWLVSEDPAIRAGLKRYLTALRQGEPASPETLEKALGSTIEALDASHRKRVLGGRWKTVSVPVPDAADLAKLALAPDDGIESWVALAFLFGRTGKGAESLKYELLQASSKKPDSPRPYEALAVMAATNRSQEDLNHYLERAREHGSANAFAYASRVAEMLRSESVAFTLKPALTETRAETLRTLTQKALSLDDGRHLMWYYLSWTEAFAPAPRRETVEQLKTVKALALLPQMQITLAIAEWRLGDHQVARQRLEAVIADSRRPKNLQGGAARLLETMQAAAAAGG